HGIAVKMSAGGHVVEVVADHITKITLAAVHTDIPQDQIGALPLYREEKWFHLGEGGLFRKHPEWKQS
ncbi:MAG: hypothetical protein ACYDC5_12140, partial [Candidatus Dormibacteria bacterium]